MTASTSSQQSPTIFTVEQLELVRRLRNSGVCKEEVIYAFDSFDKLEKDIGPIYNIPVSLALQVQALQWIAMNSTSTNAILSPSITTTSSDQSASTIQNKATPLQTIIKQDKPIDTPEVPLAPPLLDSSNNDLEVDQKEYLSFISQGEASCCEEIRNFATKHNVKQQQIATLAGICQSYVSRYMKGDIYDMSERSRRSIQKWYLVYRKNPASIGYAVNAAQHLINLNSNNPSSKKLSSSISLENLDFTSPDAAFPRRERFVFRASHLEILEKYFQDNNYPSYETREEIAKSCNVVTENTAGRELTDREKVTAQIISNWFANKRKELKKLAKEEGLIDVSSVPLRPRGHPSRVYSELIFHSKNMENSQNNISNDILSTHSSNGDSEEMG